MSLSHLGFYKKIMKNYVFYIGMAIGWKWSERFQGTYVIIICDTEISQMIKPFSILVAIFKNPRLLTKFAQIIKDFGYISNFLLKEFNYLICDV